MWKKFYWRLNDILFKIYQKNILISILQNQKIKLKKINMWLLIIDFDNIN